MANELTLPASFGKLPTSLAGANIGANDDLGAGVSASYGVIGYRGKVWSIKFGGEETPLMRDDGDGPRHSIEVIIVKASPAISKIYYKDGYEPGNSSPPDCWSGNGIAPDPSVKSKVSPTCANCPMNAWGSRTTEAGKQAKACSDSRRVAVVPMNDIDNELTGGPMLLRIPAASLKDLKGYGDLLKSYQFPYYAAATRISFDSNEAFPKFVFSAIRPLDDAEAAKIVAMREDHRIGQVLNEQIDPAAGSTTGSTAGAAAEVPASPFEQAPVTAKVTEPVKKATAPKKAPTTAATPEQIAAAKLAAAKKAMEEAEAEAAAAAAPKVKTPAEIAAEKLAAARAAMAAAEAEAAAASAPVSSVNQLLAEGDTAEEATEEGATSTEGFDALLDGLLGE